MIRSPATVCWRPFALAEPAWLGDPELLAPLDQRLATVLEDLAWWTRALAAARQTVPA
jgi:hypothetical protein